MIALRRPVVALLGCLLALPSLAQPTPPPISPDNAATLTRTATLTGHTLPVNDLDFSDDGALLVSGADDLTMRIWDVASGTESAVFEGQLHPVRSVDVSPDGRLVLTTGFNGIAFLWDVRSQTRAASVNAPRYPSISDGEFAPDGDTFALAFGTGLTQTYRTATQQPLQAFPADTLLVERIAYGPDGEQIAMGTGFPSDETLVWNTSTEALTLALDGAVGAVHGLDIAPDGVTMALGGSAGGFEIWQLSADNTDAQRLWALEQAHPDGLFDLTFNPDGTLLATAGFDGVVRLWDVESGELAGEVRGTQAARSVLAVAFSADGRTLAAAGEATDIWLWQATVSQN